MVYCEVLQIYLFYKYKNKDQNTFNCLLSQYGSVLNKKN